jgi:hypothetical protein
MNIGITVDGKSFTMKDALNWVYNETGVLNGTDIISEALADAVHQETGSWERVLLNEKGPHELVKVIIANAVMSAYLGGCLLLKQLENPERMYQLGSLLIGCWPSKGFSPYEDARRGFINKPPSLEEFLDGMMSEKAIYEKAARRLFIGMQSWVEDDRAEGRFESPIHPRDFVIAI